MVVMPAYDLVPSDRFGQDIDLPGMDLADPAWAITLHDRPLLKAHKQLPRRRDHPLPSIDLRSHYKKTPVHLAKENTSGSHPQSTTPPDPPRAALLEPLPSLSPSPIAVHEPSEHGRDDSSTADTAILRSRVATPTYQKTPPTPDMTPPRPENLLRPRVVSANVASISSRAESFKTAKEELSSDDECDDISPSQRAPRQRWLQSIQGAGMEDWKIRPSSLSQRDEAELTPTKSLKQEPLVKEDFDTFDGFWNAKDKERSGLVRQVPSLNGTISSAGNDKSLRAVSSHPSPLPTPPRSADIDEPAFTAEMPLKRGKSLRDRVEESKTVRPSDSTEKFAREIGWSHVPRSPEIRNRINSWRFSGISTTSTVEAIVVDAETPPQRQQQLRHTRKNPSLRSASSPISASNRSSLLSNPESPHRLVHKKGKITNRNRWSMGSEISRTMSVSYAMPDRAIPEVIHVAVIPERKSSLKSSGTGSQGHSASVSLSSAERRPITAPDRPPLEAQVTRREKRRISASLPAETIDENRGRDRQLPPAAPRQGSNFSEATSKSNSRANSMTSEHFRLRRLEAEEAVHRTLERMESERSVVPRYSASHTRKSSTTHRTESDSEQWDALSPPSQHTALSPPSMASASPGPVEMGEARAVNLFAHNNHSLQIIDQFPQPESRAVQSLQKSGTNDILPAERPSTPTQPTLPQLVIDSPLRNPRDPPEPPALKVIPPTPADLTPVESGDRQLGLPSPKSSKKTGSLSRRFGSFRRPTLNTRDHTESFMKSISRTLSLRSAKNMKADQPLDANLHPFWRPRGFWDDVTDSDSDRGDYDDGMIVSNSLGVPHKRTVIDGPISLVRHLSDSSRRQRRTRGVAKRSSHSSLSKMRAARKTYKIPGLGLQFSSLKFHDLQDRLQFSRWREDEKREKSRQALREMIGPQVVSTGDSRYPADIPSTRTTSTQRREGSWIDE